MSDHLKDAARAIFTDALRAVDVRAAVQQEIVQTADLLTLAGQSLPLAEIDGIILIAMGKAAVPMYMAAAEALFGIHHNAIVVAPEETLPPGTGNRDAADLSQPSAMFLPGAHPTPTAASLVAARAVLEALARVTERTAVLFLVSGGASAMVEQPLDPAISLPDLAVFSRLLVGSGLDITAMNALRKHLSAVKGGRLSVAAAKARVQCTLLVSDVPAASPDAVGSGPSLPDSTTVAESLALFPVLEQSTLLPASIVRWFRNAALPETPKAGDACFARAHWKVVLSSDHLEQAAVRAAKRAGFLTVVDNTCDDWNYRAACDHLLNRSLALAASSAQPTCLVSVGEVGVAVPSAAGEGGRNQQFALFCAAELARRGQRATVLSAGSDGIDGHSSAAGAVCDENTAKQAGSAGLSIEGALMDFHTTPLLSALGNALYTGPTGNNLRDLRLILTEPEA